jgi:asparagine synthetase B (glutamine-hydrolysing)
LWAQREGDPALLSEAVDVRLRARRGHGALFPDGPPGDHDLAVVGATLRVEVLAPGPVHEVLLQRADLGTYLPGDVLHKVDRMSLAHGLEVRSPFLDVDLAAFAFALPDRVRLPGRRTKPLLRDLALARLPPEVARAPKRGFGVPLDDWFRGPLRKPALEVLESSALARAQLFRSRYWEPFWQEHQTGRAQHGERLYALLALEVWYLTFLAGAPALERPAALSM